MVKLYVEGGGDAAALKVACRAGFSAFLTKAGLAGRMPSIVACGGRQDAYESFCTAIKNGESAMLLVDSEEAVFSAAQLGDASRLDDRCKWQPWQHLNQRKGDGWDKPINTANTDCHLMVQVMETWFLADRETLKSYFGHEFKDNYLPNVSHALEDIPKKQVFESLKNATQQCKSKGEYGKGAHSFELLARIDPAKVTAASPWALRFVEQLKTVMGV